MNGRLLASLGVCLLLLAACIPVTPPATAMPTPTLTQTPEPLSSPTPQPTPTVVSKTLTVCAGSEPADLFLYGEPSPIKSTLLPLFYDGPVELRDYAYRAVVLTKLPSLADGDAVIEAVTVQEGARVVDDSGVMIVLQPGARVRPAGCRSSACALDYAGGSLKLDRMRVLFNLLPGIEWADGAPLTAADSVFSYRVALSEDVLYSNAGLASGSAQTFTFTSEYSALDTNTVQWIGLPGFLDPDYQAAFFSPLPEHQLGNYDIPALLEANEALYAPLGWGPYRITSWEPGAGMTFEPNPNYYRAAEGLPFFEQLVVRFLGPDAQAGLAALQSGACDLLLQDVLSGASQESIRAVVESGLARLMPDLQPVVEQLTFNLASTEPFAPAFFGDLRTRRAVARCVDREALVGAVYGGLVPPLDLALPADHPFLVGAPAGRYAYDPQAGRDLLEQVGWRDEDGDGVREAHGVEGATDGQPLSVTLAVPESPARLLTTPLLVGQLEACGLRVELVQAPGRDLLAQSPEALISGRRFELASLASPFGVQALCALGETRRVSSEDNGWSGSNLSGFSDPVLDAACVGLAASLPGTEEYITMRQTVLLLLYDSLPVLPLYMPAGFTLARPELAGLTTGLGQTELQQAEEFHWQP